MFDRPPPTCKRCTVHGINFPPQNIACKVVGCEEELWPLYSDQPDEDWAEVTNAINRDAKLEDDEIIHTMPHRYDAKARIYTGENGMLWVAHAELLYNGYRGVTDGTIVFLNNTFYEVQGFVEKAGAWWVEKVEVVNAAENLTPEQFFDFG